MSNGACGKCSMFLSCLAVHRTPIRLPSEVSDAPDEWVVPWRWQGDILEIQRCWPSDRQARLLISKFELQFLRGRQYMTLYRQALQLLGYP